MSNSPTEESAPYGTGAGKPAAPAKRIRTQHLREMKGRGRAVRDAHGVRHVHRPDLRRGRHRGPARRRQCLQQRLRQRDLAARHRRRADPADPRRVAVGDAVAGGRRPALRLLPALPRAGLRHGRPVHEGGRRPRREARGRARDGAPDRAAQPRRRTRHGAHRLHPAERARPRRLPGAGPRRDRRPDPGRRARHRGGRRVRGGDGDGARRRGRPR